MLLLKSQPNRTDYARHHALLDWTGDGVDEIVIAQPRALYDGAGQVLAVLGMDATDDLHGEERLVLSADFSGDGVPDLLLTTRAISHVHIYRNERGRRPNPPAQLGTGLNVTLYGDPGISRASVNGGCGCDRTGMTCSVRNGSQTTSRSGLT